MMNQEMRGYRNERVLYDLYWRRNMSATEVGKVFDVTGSTIRRWMEIHGIKRREKYAHQWSLLDDQKQEIYEMLDERGPTRRSLTNIVMPDDWNARP